MSLHLQTFRPRQRIATQGEYIQPSQHNTIQHIPNSIQKKTQFKNAPLAYKTPHTPQTTKKVPALSTNVSAKCMPRRPVPPQATTASVRTRCGRGIKLLFTLKVRFAHTKPAHERARFRAAQLIDYLWCRHPALRPPTTSSETQLQPPTLYVKYSTLCAYSILLNCPVCLSLSLCVRHSRCPCLSVAQRHMANT